MRGRLTVGRDALNVLVLVRLQPPQLGQSRGPAATTPGLHPGNGGSSPSGTTDIWSSWSSLECSSPCRGEGPPLRGGAPVQIRSETLLARYANWQSGEAQNFVIVCGFDSHPRH